MSAPVGYVIREAWRGKTLGRLLVNHALSRHLAPMKGKALDIAGGTEPSYLRFVPKALTLLRTNRVASDGVAAVDFNRPLPFGASSFDAVFLFNAVYIAEDPHALAREILRVLRPGGTWIVVSPFIANEMREPHDYLRLTAEGLERLCMAAGYSDIVIERVGERASAAAHLMHPFWRWRWLRMPVFLTAAALDAMIPTDVKRKHPAPLSYIVSCKKPL